jgi:metal-dependent HD superfamily phosphatase/phosphodiesterase
MSRINAPDQDTAAGYETKNDPSRVADGIIPDQMEVASQIEPRLVTIDQVRRDQEVIVFLQQANETLRRIGYTEHGQRHAGLVGHIGENVLSEARA